jgi:hypothetical protein
LTKEMDKINREHVVAGLIGGGLSLVLAYAFRKYSFSQAKQVTKAASGMRYPPIQHPKSALNFDSPPTDPMAAFK